MKKFAYEISDVYRERSGAVKLTIVADYSEHCPSISNWRFVTKDLVALVQKHIGEDGANDITVKFDKEYRAYRNSRYIGTLYASARADQFEDENIPSLLEAIRAHLAKHESIKRAKVHIRRY